MAGPFKMKGWSPFHKHEKDKDGNVIHHTYYPDKEPGDNYYESEEYKEKRKLKLIKDEKAKAKRIEVADVFDLNNYNKYKQAVSDDNVLEIFPDEDIFELEKMRKLFEKEMERQQS